MALLRIPEKRFSVDSFVRLQFGKLFSGQDLRFLKLDAGVRSEWFPRATGDDYSVSTQFRTGSSLGQPPFDELFILGLERDNDLWMRGHIATEDRKRGSGFLGRKYFLFNAEMDKKLFHLVFMDVRLGPCLDVGRIYDQNLDFGSVRWLWDLGLLLKLRLPGGLTAILSYGKDLRTGRNQVYLSARQP